MRPTAQEERSAWARENTAQRDVREGMGESEGMFEVFEMHWLALIDHLTKAVTEMENMHLLWLKHTLRESGFIKNASKFNVRNFQNNCELATWNIFLKAFKLHHEYLSHLLPGTHLKPNSPTKKHCQIEI